MDVMTLHAVLSMRGYVPVSVCLTFCLPETGFDSCKSRS